MPQRCVEMKATRERKSKRTKNDEEVLSRFAHFETIRSPSSCLEQFYYLVREKVNRRIVIPCVTLRYGEALSLFTGSTRAALLNMIFNSDAGRIHAVISATLIMLTSFTRDRHANHSCRVSHRSLVCNSRSRSPCVQSESFPGRGSFRHLLSRNNDNVPDFTVALMNLLSSLTNGMGARSVPWPSTFPGRKGLTDCCFSPCVAPGARIDPLVRARHSAASVHPRDPVTRRHHRRQPSTRSASSYYHRCRRRHQQRVFVRFVSFHPESTHPRVAKCGPIWIFSYQLPLDTSPTRFSRAFPQIIFRTREFHRASSLLGTVENFKY